MRVGAAFPAAIVQTTLHGRQTVRKRMTKRGRELLFSRFAFWSFLMTQKWKTSNFLQVVFEKRVATITLVAGTQTDLKR
ncbi:hypothetical protein D918_05113 [Trichuris suis]|nr:hypothetical protein D918_05113 [Trichuris suis]